MTHYQEITCPDCGSTKIGKAGFNASKTQRYIIIMMNKVPDCTNMVLQFFGKGQGFSHQPGAPLPQCTVEAFDMVCQAGFLANGPMPFRWKHLAIG